ncbi:ArdC-like ssDNA-binding domain-containing protein [Microtetraspora malaysiensis]|uniref:ArdC-like ssDNA-binding domain-containing protein n=1 Tax=Microtetraspora malaysiensis TaxID=161358 RepID=UPI003D910B79
MATATKKKPRKGRKVTEKMQAQDKASKAEANEALHTYAVLCLSDPAELEQFRSLAASVGWKDDPASDQPGYSLLNVMLLAARRRPLTWCGGFESWLEHGRCVAEGEKSLATFRHIGRKKSDEERAEEKKLADEGWQTTKRGPRYYVKRGTFDVTQTVPRKRCPHCGTAPTSPEDRTTKCPSTCAVLAARPGVRPPRELVLALMQDQLKESDEDEGEADE